MADLDRLRSLESQYRIAKEMGYHKNEYWSSIHRTITRMKAELKEQNANS